MQFSVVIATRLRARLLAGTLKGLAQQTDTDFEAIVVCDGQDDETRRLSETLHCGYPLTWIFSAENKGLPWARNRGAEAAHGEYFVFLDDDTVPTPSWLSEHRKRHLSDLELNLAVVGKVLDVYSREPLSKAERFLRLQRLETLANLEAIFQLKGAASVDSTAYQYRSFGVNCSIRRSAFLTAGSFDPALRECEEEMEMGSRLYDRGIHFVFEPDATAHHHDTKDLVDYSLRCWNAAGRIDLYRAAHKHQRNPQTKGVTYASLGFLRASKARLSWHAPDAIRAMASICRVMTEATGLSQFFRLWSAAAFSAEYWQGIRSKGQTLDSLRQLGGSAITVVAFHGIFQPQSSEERKYHLSPKRFRRVLQLLSKKYQFATPDESFSGGLSNPLILTFDDGYEDFYGEVFPHVSPMGLKPLVFLVVDQIGGVNLWDQAHARPQRLLNAGQIREMHEHGVQFGSHSLTHPSLPQLSSRELRREVGESKSRLEDLLGDEVECFAYPYGDVDSRVRAIVAEAGYRFAFTISSGRNLWDDPFALKRIEVSEQDAGINLQVKLRTGRNFEAEVRSLVWRNLPAFAKDPIRRILRRERPRTEGH